MYQWASVHIRHAHCRWMSITFFLEGSSRLLGWWFKETFGKFRLRTLVAVAEGSDMICAQRIINLNAPPELNSRKIRDIATPAYPIAHPLPLVRTSTGYYAP